MANIFSKADNQLDQITQKAQNWYESNKKNANIIGVALLLLIVILVAIKFYWIPKQNEACQEAMYAAQIYFERDSFSMALNGSKTPADKFQGFAQIASEFKYKFTPAGNLAEYYAGLCCLYTGKYDKAIEYFKAAKINDPEVCTNKCANLGDAYSEKGNMKEAMKHYSKSVKCATKCSKNEFLAPIIILKAAFAAEKAKDTETALEYYNLIKENYPNADEARDIEKYIARLTAK